LVRSGLRGRRSWRRSRGVGIDCGGDDWMMDECGMGGMWWYVVVASRFCEYVAHTFFDICRFDSWNDCICTKSIDEHMLLTCTYCHEKQPRVRLPFIC
jgi:hypothetical protein